MLRKGKMAPSVMRSAKERGEKMRLAELGPDNEGAARLSPEPGTQIEVVSA
jgi:hypothetical protein